MEMQKLDIVNLIDNNPIIKLSEKYQNNFLTKLKEKFTESEQRLFVSSFYCYLNYNSKTDFVIDMSDVWKWLGFGRKEECKRVLTKHFTQNIHYKIHKDLMEENKAPQVGGGTLYIFAIFYKVLLFFTNFNLKLKFIISIVLLCTMKFIFKVILKFVFRKLLICYMF
jgi:hypothetical protein